MPPPAAARLESERERGCAEDGGHGGADVLGGAAAGMVGATADARRDATGGLDGVAEEVRSARAVHGVVEVGLAAHEGRVAEAGRVRAVALERDVRREDTARAGRAEIRVGHAGLQEEVHEVRLGERGRVGDQRGHGVVTAAQGGVHVEVVLEVRLAAADGDVDVDGRGRGHLGGAVATAVRLAADGLTKRGEDVEDVVGKEDIGVGSGGELGLAGGVEVAELAANQAVWAGREGIASAERGKSRLNSRRRGRGSVARGKGGRRGNDGRGASTEARVGVKVGKVVGTSLTDTRGDQRVRSRGGGSCGRGRRLSRDEGSKDRERCNGLHDAEERRKGTCVFVCVVNGDNDEQ